MSTGSPTPTFRPLNGRLGWHTNRKSGISVSQSGLRLEAAPGGPLSLGWIDGSLGGLTLPRGFALDDRRNLYLLDPPRPTLDRSRRVQRVRKYDPRTKTFAPMPALGGWGEEPRRFRHASNVSIAGEDLYVADDDNNRIQVFSLETLQLLHVWQIDGDRRHVEPTQPAIYWLDVASHHAVTYILDGSRARVFRHVRGEDAPAPFIHVVPGARQWSRIAVDRQGRVYLLDARRSFLDAYGADGEWLQQVTDAGDVRDRFDPPAITLIVGARTRPKPAPEYFRISRPLAPEPGEDLLFDRRGDRVRIPKADLVQPKLYREQGIWVSKPIDSGIHACQWHRLDVAIPDLPPGSHLVVSTFTSDVATGHPHEGSLSPEGSPLSQPSPLWQPSLRVWGRMQPGGGRPGTDDGGPSDSLVQSREGQYLWVLVQLKGDGFGSPMVSAIDAHFPRDSYLRYLPAIYSTDDESRWFLERFLSIFQTEWDAIERRVRDMARYFDVNATPAEGGWLETLASWMAVQLEQTWTDEQKRNLLRVAPQLLGRRGTRAALREFVQAYLQNMTGLSPEHQGRWPVIVEAFRERQRLLLGARREGVLGAGAVLWSASVVGRPQLDVFAQEGSMRLVSTGDPARDLFHQHSHRFTVSVPAAWIRTADDERMLRRAIDAEKPAHTSYDLHLIAPRFRVGVQSTVGIDTIVGGYPVAHVDGACASAAPGLPPRNRLGYDTVLGGHPPASPRVQMPHSRIGLDTVLN